LGLASHHMGLSGPGRHTLGSRYLPFAFYLPAQTPGSAHPASARAHPGVDTMKSNNPQHLICNVSLPGIV
jgi:hypothetical protein